MSDEADTPMDDVNLDGAGVTVHPDGDVELGSVVSDDVDRSKSSHKRKMKAEVRLMDGDSEDDTVDVNCKVVAGGTWEGVDFDIHESTVWLKRKETETKRDLWKKNLFSWANTGIVAVLTALVAFSIDSGIKGLTHLKFAKILVPLTTSDHPKYEVVLGFVGFNIGFCAIAAGLVVGVATVAAGSGIPEIKCILNGNRQNHALRLKTLIVKGVGVLFSVAGSLPVGKEGPMIHSGAIIGAGVGSGMSTTLKFKAKFNSQFRNDLEKRDQVAAGAAAGVAAAFGAPIGGVLFALEEGASYWNQTITWRTFFGTMCGAFILDTLISATNTPSRPDGLLIVDRSSIIEFGRFAHFHKTFWAASEFPLIIILGVIMGLVGALFNDLQKRLTIWRMKNVAVTSPFRRFMEVMFVALMASLCGVCMPLLISEEVACVDLAKAGKDPDVLASLQQFFCPDGQWNQAATLFFNLSEKAILNLFHNTHTFHMGIVFLFFVTYMLLAVLTYGIAVPSGLFVPCLTVGAAIGRFYGQLVHLMFPSLAITNIGFYALLGAGGMLGGCARLTISATVILLEATQNVAYTVPVMFTTMVAKKVGDLFNHGLYDIHIFLKKIPLLEELPPEFSERVQVVDLLTREMVSLPEIVTVSDIVDRLVTTTHNSFPVVRNSDGVFSGLIARSRLTSILKLKGWTTDRPDDIVGRNFDARNLGSILKDDDLQSFYPRFPAIGDLTFTPEERQCWIDLTPYMNPAAYTVADSTPASRVFRLFRGMGLRSLPVLNHLDGRPVGVITRKCLEHETIHAAMHTRQRRSRRHAEI